LRRYQSLSWSRYSLFLMALPAHSGPWPFNQFRNHFSQTVGLLRWEISPSQGRYLNTGQHKHNKRIHIPNIRALTGIRTHDSSIRASEDGSYLRPRGHSDRPKVISTIHKPYSSLPGIHKNRPLESPQPNERIDEYTSHLCIYFTKINFDLFP
jgi:hypothetical protein